MISGSSLILFFSCLFSKLLTLFCIPSRLLGVFCLGFLDRNILLSFVGIFLSFCCLPLCLF
ncbi:hypothetical protein CCZ28_01670 [Pseudomonas oryzihabitans]|nr:hypothetical protein CCZ28_01670 [Pseudomonas psychrotolerans]